MAFEESSSKGLKEKILLNTTRKGVFVMYWQEFNNQIAVKWEVENVPNELGDLARKIFLWVWKGPPGLLATVVKYKRREIS